MVRGAGGRSSVSGMRACVFGSTGFVGRYVVSTLGKYGSTMRIAYRGEEVDFRHLRVAGDLGQVNPVKVDPYDYESIKAAMEHCNVVVNCTGNDFETSNWSWEATHSDLPEAMAMAASEMGIERFVHMSAMGADEESSSGMLRSKAIGEKKVLAAFPTATILRPAPIVGTEDRYFNFMKKLSSTLPGPMRDTFPLADGNSVNHQPVTVQDVADATWMALQTGEHHEATRALGNTYELAGDKVYSTEECAQLFWDSVKTLQMDRAFSPVPWPLLKFHCETRALRLPFLNPNPEVTPDQAHRLLRMDFLKSPDTLGLQDLGVTPSSIESEVDFLKVYWQGGQRGSGFLEV